MHIKTIFLFAFFLIEFASASEDDEWQILRNNRGDSVTAKLVSLHDGQLKVIRKSDRQAFVFPVDSLIEADQELVSKWAGAAITSATENADDGTVSRRLFPRTRAEIKETLREIEKRSPKNGVSSTQQKAINELNIYRYLCGVPYDVEATPDLVEKATEAAIACKKHGGLSHDLGHNTNRCNLSTMGDIVATVAQYILDPGENNREARGHRRWCLNPPMKLAAFGSAGSSYSAMWCMDSSGKRSQESWAYPGKGFFPSSRLHGNAWSLYLPNSAPAKEELTVEVWKIGPRPDREIPWGEKPNGRLLPCTFVHVSGNAINFEPQDEPITGRGTFWVRISGGGIKEQYAVELY